MTNEDFCSYEIAVQLKKLGFDYPCYFYYTKKDAPEECVWHTTSEEAPIDYNRSVYAECSMPSLAQAQKWLREVKDCVVLAKPQIEDIDYTLTDNWYYEVWIDDNIFAASDIKDICFPYYESALSAGIKAALELINYNTK